MKKIGFEFFPDFFESIFRTIKHKILPVPRNFLRFIFGFVRENIVYIGWGLVIIGSIFGIILLVLYVTKKPKEEIVPEIQTNQPRAMEPTNQEYSGAILYVTQPNGYRENIPMYYDRMIIGTHPSCQIVLLDSKISQQHAEIYIQEGRYFVRDLGSATGTFVNGALIEGVVELFQGYYVQMGDSTIQL